MAFVDLRDLRQELLSIAGAKVFEKTSLENALLKCLSIFEKVELSLDNADECRHDMIELLELFHALLSIPISDVSLPVLEQILLLITSIALKSEELLRVAFEEIEPLLFCELFALSSSAENSSAPVFQSQEERSSFQQIVLTSFACVLSKIYHKGRVLNKNIYQYLIASVSSKLSQLAFVSTAEAEYLDLENDVYWSLKTLVNVVCLLRHSKVAALFSSPFLFSS